MADGHLGVGGRLAAGPSDELIRAGYGAEAAAGPALADALSRSDLAHAIALIEGGGIDREQQQFRLAGDLRQRVPAVGEHRLGTRIDDLPGFLRGETQHRRDQSQQPLCDVMQCVLRRAPRRRSGSWPR